MTGNYAYAIKIPLGQSTLSFLGGAPFLQKSLRQKYGSRDSYFRPFFMVESHLKVQSN